MKLYNINGHTINLYSVDAVLHTDRSNKINIIVGKTNLALKFTSVARAKQEYDRLITAWQEAHDELKWMDKPKVVTRH